jgi:DNA-binding transcriptional ArsR family regulator
MTETTVEPDLTPAEVRLISDVESLKAISDPIRLRILEAMTQAAGEDWTVKRIAAALGVGPTKLYHHVAILEERDFIRVSGKRVVSGIIETRYRIAQLNVRLDRALLSGSGPTDAATAAIEDVVRTVFETALEDVGRALRSGAMEVDADGGSARGVLRQDIKRLSAARAAELRERIIELLDEYDDNEAETGGEPVGLLVAMYPITDGGSGSVDATEEPAHG